MYLLTYLMFEILKILFIAVRLAYNSILVSGYAMVTQHFYILQCDPHTCLVPTCPRPTYINYMPCAVPSILVANSLCNWKLILLISFLLFPPVSPTPDPSGDHQLRTVLAHLHTTGSWCGTWLVAGDTQLFVRFPLQCEAGRTSSTPISG